MTQTAVPIADVATTNWEESAGDGDGDAFDELDEGFPSDDAVTAWQTNNEGNNSLRCDLGSVTDPVSSSSHNVRVRVKKNAVGGRQLDLTFDLNDPDNIFSDSRANIGSLWTTFTHALSGAEADIIDNYGTLDVELLILENGGGTPRVGLCSAMDFQCPDAGGGGGFVHSQGVFVG